MTHFHCQQSSSEALENAKAYLDRAIASFEGDPPDNQFLRGFLAALEVVRDEAFSGVSNG